MQICDKESFDAVLSVFGMILPRIADFQGLGETRQIVVGCSVVGPLMLLLWSF